MRFSSDSVFFTAAVISFVICTVTSETETPTIVFSTFPAALHNDYKAARGPAYNIRTHNQIISR